MNNNNDQKLIADFNLELIADFFKDFDRQGPCCENITLKALSFIDELPENPQILDIGCGTGGQTITLANNIRNADITAIDLIPDFIEMFKRRIKGQSFKSKIIPYVASMNNPPVVERTLDVIWAEGSIYHLGFENGLRKLNNYLKTGGYIAVSEVSWFNTEQPQQVVDFWMENYPEIDTIHNKIGQMQYAGYKPLAHFVFPEYCWWNYFNPIKDYLNTFLEIHNYSDEAKEFTKYMTDEIEIYNKYKSHYGYVFYVGQKQ